MPIDEVSEHVDVAPLVDGSDLDPGTKEIPEAVGGTLTFFKAGDGVVVGDAHGPDPGPPGEIDELGRIAKAVRRSRMKMKVDHARRAHAGAL